LTSCRRHCEKGNFDFVKKYFERCKGSFPMCCFLTRKTGNGKSDYELTCDWIGVWLPPKEFEKRCLECQKEIGKMLEGSK